MLCHGARLWVLVYRCTLCNAKSCLALTYVVLSGCVLLCVQVNAYMHGWVGGWVHGWIDGWTDGMYVCIRMY